MDRYESGVSPSIAFMSQFSWCGLWEYCKENLGSKILSSFRTERPTNVSEQPVQTRTERIVQSMDFLAGTSKLVCKQLVVLVN